ncbi:hypothetical protein [Pedobacter cryotolerans]|nr:hypothetical protein [Pedobacter cryotolerans]
MNKLKNALSDLFSLLVPKENNGIYSWGELVIGIVLIGMLAFAFTLFGN